VINKIINNNYNICPIYYNFSLI